MTWNSSVSHCVQGSTASMWSSRSWPSSIQGAAIIQWPMTTAPIDTARRRST